MTHITRTEVTNSYLNADWWDYQKQKSKLGQNRKDQEIKLSRLEKKLDALKREISECKENINQIKDEEINAKSNFWKENDARSEVCILIAKHNFHYGFDQPAYIESDETIELENQEIFIDNWQDALDRCKQLTENNS